MSRKSVGCLGGPAVAAFGVLAFVTGHGVGDELPNLADRAGRFLAEMTPQQREAGTWAFTDRERYDIHFAPFDLEGVRHGELSDMAKNTGESLLAAFLSGRGHEKTRAIRQLELDIRELESGRSGVEEFRDPERYYWAVFGEPAVDAAWGFRFEGHHLSLNVTATPGQPAATLPLFLGAQPRLVPAGMPSAGVAVLGEEERLARELYDSLDESQRAAATLPYKRGRGHMLGQVSTLRDPASVGLPRRDMNDDQRAMLDAFLTEFAGLWNADIEAARLKEINDAREGLHFAFVDRADPPFSFYVRVSGPGVLIEIDNTAGGDHLHAVWHRPGADFGEDLLAAHLERHHGVLARR
ncbi:MAG: DUF3500 domain-containing protein [Gammaproteobacteria bacterium]|nr:DUF3500 domain-containing protein [Gammaproteobacteria bacterium]